ncbi:hypothetical protein P5673_007561 [Acropora cervicornis]|uniref:Uncharacterized protein n=1 Tax=Acropora cervicornis TaxID=6130 RepID=A0AAD9VBN5_ACRCE|nr:hypothetical protein P5673_007561 [Acropora cervicornis]
MQGTNWLEEKSTILKSIKAKEERLKDYEKENELKKSIEVLQAKVDTLKQEVEVLRLRKRLKELEDENEALICSTHKF